MGGVDDEDVGAGGDERLRALDRVRPDPDRCTHPEPPLRVLRGAGELDPLGDVLDRDQPAQDPVLVDDRELLDPVAVEKALGLAEGRPDRRGHEVARGHQRRDRLRDVLLEAEVAVREDPDEAASLLGDRHPGDVVVLHQLERVGDERGRRQGQRLDDHPGLGALDLVHLGHLVGDREVAVDDPDPALAGESDRHPRLGHRVHRGGDDRDLERDRPGQPGRGRDVVREHGRLRRNQQDVVEGEAFLRRTSRNGRARNRPAARLSRSPSATRYRPLVAGRVSLSAATSASSVTVTPACSRARLARVEVAGAELEHRRRARGDRLAQRLLVPAAGVPRGEEAGEQRVACADSRDRLDPRRVDAVAAHVAVLAQQRVAPALGRDDHVPRAAVGDRLERRARSPRRRGTPGRRATPPPPGSA